MDNAFGWQAGWSILQWTAIESRPKPLLRYSKVMVCAQSISPQHTGVVEIAPTLLYVRASQVGIATTKFVITACITFGTRQVNHLSLSEA